MSTHFHDTREARQPAPAYRRERSQDYAIGSTVRVGFVAGLTVVAFDGTRDTLERNGLLYSWQPHKGLTPLAGGPN